MTVRVFGCVVLVALCAPFMAVGQQPPPAAPAGVVPPDQKLPPHIRKLTGSVNGPSFRWTAHACSFSPRRLATPWRSIWRPVSFAT